MAPHGGLPQAVARNRRALEQLAWRARNIEPASRRTVADIQTMIGDAYEGTKEPFGRRWARLKYRKPPPPPLQLTGRSRSSIRLTVATGGAIKFAAADYLFFHMSGVPSRNLPRRNPTPFDLVNGKWTAKRRLWLRHRAYLHAWIRYGRGA